MQMVKENPAVELPNNHGDPLYTTYFSMRYGEQGEAVYDTLIVPTEVMETTNSRGSVTSTVTNAVQKSGEPFTIYFVINNHGADDVFVVDVMDGDTVVGSKTMAISGGEWRICQMEITLEGAGEHTITVGNLSDTVFVE